MSFLRKIYYFLIDTLQTLLLAASFFFIVYVFLMRPYQVTGSSMHPSFIDKEYVLTDLITPHFNGFYRGDVVVFNSPTDEEKDFIKRIIGVPQDTVTLKNNQIFINDEKLDESLYLEEDVETLGGAFLSEGSSAIVPNGQYFVLGDNRGASSDSREWGFVKREEIIGRSFIVYWPPPNARIVKNPFEE